MTKIERTVWIEKTAGKVDSVFWPNEKGTLNFEQTDSLLKSLGVPPFDALYFSLTIEIKPWPERAKFPQEFDVDWHVTDICGECSMGKILLNKELKAAVIKAFYEEVSWTVKELLKEGL